MHYKKDRKENHIHLRLTDDEMRELEMASYLDGRTKSDFIRRALNYYLYSKEDERKRYENAGRS